MNLMTQPGETDGMTAADHVRALLRHAPRLPIHDVLLAAGPISPRVRAAYAAYGAKPVAVDLAALRALGCRPLRRPMVAARGWLRHEPRRLAAAILGVAAELRGGQPDEEIRRGQPLSAAR
jgi:2-phospho-L-lactate transferase/gluconeogenesis factor (CofD/UPF0052 family)